MCNGRYILLATVFSILVIFDNPALGADEERIIVLDTTVINWKKRNQHEPDKPGNVARARRMTEQLRRSLDNSKGYDVVKIDKNPQTIIDKYVTERRDLYKCDNCIVDIGRTANVDLVFFPGFRS